jgi:hypothetical protein
MKRGGRRKEKSILTIIPEDLALEEPAKLEESM